MHFSVVTALVTALLAAPVVLGQNCPVVTKTELASSCGKRCGNSDCLLVTTVQNPCGCPAAVPTATLIAPCGNDCPYNGCGVEVRTLNAPCQPTSTRRTTTTTSTRRPTRRTSTTSSTRRTSTSTTSTPSVSWGVTLLPPAPTTTSTTRPPTPAQCPTVTQITRPNDCAAIRCPVPNCIQQEELVLPCGCSGPRTLLYVQPCQTACPEGCMTRTQTVSRAC